MDGVGQKVRQVCCEDDQATLSLRNAPHVGELEHERDGNADHDTNEQTPEEDAKEDAKGFEETDDAEFLGAVLVLLGSLEQDDGDGIVQNGLAKDEGVQLWFDLVGVEDGENGDWVGSREGSANRHGLDEVDLEAIEGYASPQEQDEAQDKSGYEGAGECKGQDGANVSEEIPLDDEYEDLKRVVRWTHLVQFVAGR